MRLPLIRSRKALTSQSLAIRHRPPQYSKTSKGFPATIQVDRDDCVTRNSGFGNSGRNQAYKISTPPAPMS